MSSAEPRWATFDCYGTLVDWNAGIARELKRLLGSRRALARYHAIEPRVQRERPTAELPRSDGGRAGRARGRGGVALPDEERGRARAFAAGLAGLPGGARRARRGARAGLAARRAHQHRSRPDRRVAASDRRPVRTGDRRLRNRLIQAGARALAAFDELTAPTRTGTSTSPRAIPRRRAAHGSESPGLDQPPRRTRRAGAHAELPDLTGLADVLDGLVAA